MKLKRERTASRSRPARLPPSEPSGARPLPDSGPYAQVRCCLREAPAQEGAETSPPRRRGRAGPDRTGPPRPTGAVSPSPAERGWPLRLRRRPDNKVRPSGAFGRLRQRSAASAAAVT